MASLPGGPTRAEIDAGRLIHGVEPRGCRRRWDNYSSVGGMKGPGYAKHQEQGERGQGRKVSMPGHQAMVPVWATGRKVEQEVR